MRCFETARLSLFCKCGIMMRTACVVQGDMYEVGAESGRYYCLNVPLRDGIDDQSELRTVPSRDRSVLQLCYLTLCECRSIFVCAYFRLQATLPAGY